MSQTGKIAILMATYNGERFIAEQIRSLLSQTYKDWHLYVHDDGSQDGTVAVLKEFANRHPDKISILDYPSAGRPCSNFLSMLNWVEAPYYMFCDQDDVWLPRKIELSMDELRQMEREHPRQGIVVYTDLQIVDENLAPIRPSMWEHAGVYPQYIRTFADSGGHTAIATGCTMMLNKQAKTVVGGFPAKKALMHDIWVCLCVLKGGGVLKGIKDKTVLYRQHGNNTLGATSIASSRIGIRYRILHLKKVYNSNKRYYSMLSSLDYGSWVNYLLAKIRYKRRIRRGRY